MKNLEGRELFGIKLGKNCKMEKDSWQDYFEVIDDDDDMEMLLKATKLSTTSTWKSITETLMVKKQECGLMYT